MVPSEYTLLWAKIQNFQFDDPAAARPFSEKLAADRAWSPSFTKDAIEEYRKFLFLCCILENGAAPSKIVDEVWHLHLTYTRNYWIDLCRDTLGKDIHHYPSTGGPAEDAKHRQWYKDTLQSYENIFDTKPPSSIWPGSADEIETPQRPPFSWTSATGYLIITIAIIPLVFIATQYHTINPFSLGGPHFLNSINALIGETVFIGMIFLIITVIFSRRLIVGRSLRRLFNERLRPGNDLITQYALQGAPAISGMAAGLMLTGIFTAYAAETAVAGKTAMSSWWISTSAGGSGSSCSSAGSCSGGSSCGSSCGGCSGG